MIPHDTLAAELSAALESQRRHGRNTWQRFADWTRNAPRWDDTERGGGVGSGRSDFAIADLGWTVQRTGGQAPWSFHTTYNLARTPAGWRILLCTAYQEQPLDA